ncbi:hypothetical protein SPCG_1379 [Streptococcus pneumoniae CGSP14]|nr:hypothetical protein SPCG_1379 [Streptococcus pneumoniae CGSP14]
MTTLKKSWAYFKQKKEVSPFSYDFLQKIALVP